MSMTKGVLLSLVLYSLLSAVALAQEGSPTNPLHEAKRQAEEAELRATTEPLQRASLHLRHAEERLVEIKELSFSGRWELAEGLAREYEFSIREALGEIDAARLQGQEVGLALEEVEEATRRHTQVLTELLATVPEEARPAIEHALGVSKHGRNEALGRLGAIQMGQPYREPGTIHEPPGVPDWPEAPSGPRGPMGPPRGGFGGRGR
jgi:hypothetical protein